MHCCHEEQKMRTNDQDMLLTVSVYDVLYSFNNDLVLLSLNHISISKFRYR